MRHYLLAALAVSLAAAQVCERDLDVPICENVKAVGATTGRTECQYTRDYYECLRIRGCYRLPDGCLDANEVPVSCQELCEAEPGLNYCIDPVDRSADPFTDYHLCPHIPKSLFTTVPPSSSEVLNAPSVDLSLAVWTSTDERNLLATSPGSVLPALFPEAAQQALGGLFGIHPLAVVLELPVSYRGYPIALPNGPEVPAFSEQTTFIYANLHVIEDGGLNRVRTEVVNKLISANATHLGELAESIKAELNQNMPASAHLTVSNTQVFAVLGRAPEFPEIVTTTVLTTTTTTMDPALLITPHRAWRVRCAEAIVHRWEIVELEMWADKCPWLGGVRMHMNLSNASTPRLNIISSGDLVSFAGHHAADFAFDNDPYGRTGSWVSSCSGCVPGEAWLGLDAGVDGEKFTATCAVIYQAESPTSQCRRIVLESQDSGIWEERDFVEGFAEVQRLCIRRTALDYPLLECGNLDDGCGGTIQFGFCPGSRQVCVSNRCICENRIQRDDAMFNGWECGAADDGCTVPIDFGNCTEGAQCRGDHQCSLDDNTATQWRIVCESGTQGRWWLREVEFHTDGLCTKLYEAYKDPMTSGSVDIRHKAETAFDYNPATTWGSQCERCDPREAWIGLDFGAVVKVGCVKMHQADQTVNQCQRIVLEYSNSQSLGWNEQARFGFGGHALRAQENLVPMMDLEQNDEKDLKPYQLYAQSWRLGCTMSELPRQWGVYEIEWYDNTACKGRITGVTKKILNSLSGAYPASNAFDLNEGTIWKSGCGLCTENECNPCEEGQAFLGMVFNKLLNVQCVKIVQMDFAVGGCNKMTLSLSLHGEDGPWKRKTTWEGVGAFAYLITRDADGASAAAVGLLPLGVALLALLT